MGLFSRLIRTRTEPGACARDAFEHLEGDAALFVARLGDAQRAEYAHHGVELVLECLALEEGRVSEARTRLEARLSETTSAVWLYREVARARLASGDLEGARSANLAFLERADVSPDADALWSTYQDLVRIEDARGDVEAAISAFERAADALDEDARPVFSLGQYLRMRGRADEAFEVLSSLRGSTVPEATLLEELGLTELARGNEREARSMLEAVAKAAACKCGSRVPEATLQALCSIYVANGEHEKAAELERTLVRNGCATH